MKMELADAVIHYEESGKGIPLIFLHGYHIDHKCFYLPVEKRWRGLKGFRRIYPDLPGMGLTQLNRPVSSTEKLFSLLIQFIDRITDRKPFALAGYSYGGYLARGVLKHRSHLVLGMFLLCPVVIPERKSRILPEMTVLEKDSDLISGLSEDERGFFTESAVIQTREVYMRMKEEIFEPLKLADRKMMKDLKRQAYGFESPIDNIQINYSGPVSFLAGRQDFIVGYEDIYGIYNDYDHGELIILDKAGHNLQIERADEFKRVFLLWIERVKVYYSGSSSMAMVKTSQSSGKA